MHSYIQALLHYKTNNCIYVFIAYFIYQVKDHVTNAVIIISKYIALYILLQALIQKKSMGAAGLGI